MQELLRKIEEIYNDIRDLTLQAGVPVVYILSVIEADEHLTIENLQNRLDFLIRIQPLYNRVKYIWNLVSPQVWANYKMLGLNDLPEQVQLRQAYKNLRREWKKKYAKTKISEPNSNQENSPTELLQSKG